jgi:hypothetical protein
MVPGRIEGNPEPRGQLPGGKRLRPLELGQDRCALAFVTDGQVGLDQGKRGTHMGEMLSKFVGIVKSHKTIGTNT